MGRRKSIVWAGIGLCGLLTATGCEDPKQRIAMLEEDNRGLYAELEMLRAFNMGVGMVVIAKDDPELDDAWLIGEVVAGSDVTYGGSL